MRLPTLLTLATVCAFAISIAPRGLTAQSKQKGDRNRITASDLAEAPASVNTAYDIIRVMRPLWLSPSKGRTASSTLMDGAGRGGDFGDAGSGTSIGGAKDVVVYIDDVRQQSIDDLKTVKASLVTELRYLEQNRAVQMHGPGHEMGAIEVTTVNAKSKKPDEQ